MEGAWGQMKGLLEGLLKEAKQIPYTVIAVLALYAVITFYVLPAAVLARASATSVDALTRNLANLEKKLGAMDDNIRLANARALVVALDSQLFQIEQEQRRAERAGEVVSEVILQQLHELQNEKAVAMAELRVLLDRSDKDASRDP